MVAPHDMPPPTPVRILHLADIHLGMPLPWLGLRGAAQRERIREAFADIVEKAATGGYHLVLIAGDLFAVPRPSRSLVGFAGTLFARLAGVGVQTVIVAGESDALDDRGTYADGAFDDVPGVRVLSAAPETVEFSHLGVAVSGRSFQPEQDPVHVLRSISSREDLRTIGLLHVPARSVQGNEAFTQALAISPFAYLALGGSHQTLNPGRFTVPAWYPGCLEMIESGGPPGVALQVDLYPDTVNVVPLPLARRRFQRMTLEPVGFESQAAITDAIERHADPDLILEVRFVGRERPAQYIDVHGLQQELASRFFALDIVDDSMPDLSLLDGRPIPEISARGKFLALMTRQLEDAENHAAGSVAERRRIAAALRLGLWLLSERRES